MKVYLPESLGALAAEIQNRVPDLDDAEVALLLIDDRFVVDDEYQKVREHPHIVVIIQSNLHRRYISDDLRYDLCCNIRNKKHRAELIVDLNGDNWNHSPSGSVEAKAKKVSQIKVMNEKLLEEQALLLREKDELLARKFQEEERLRLERSRLAAEKIQLSEEKKVLTIEKSRAIRDDGGMECVICMSEKIGALVEPCSHLFACYPCATKCKECAICRGQIKSIKQLFVS